MGKFKTIQVFESTKNQIEKLSEESGISQCELVSAIMTWFVSNDITVEKGKTVIKISGDVKKP
jgi:hypothetical protein